MIAKVHRLVLGQGTGSLIFALPAVLLVLSLFVVPIVLVLKISIAEPTLGLGNFRLLLESAAIRSVFGKTFQIATIVTLVAVSLAYVCAFALAHSSPSVRGLLLICILVPLWSSVLIRAFSWVTLLRGNGLINQGLLSLGVIHQPLGLLRNDLGVVLGMVHVMLPLATLPIYSVMQSIDRRVIDAARSLGATERRAIVSVLLPLSLPGVVAASVLVFVTSLGFFITPAVLGGGKTVMVAEYVQLQITTTLRWGLGAMMATVLLATVACLFVVGTRIPALRQQYRM